MIAALLDTGTIDETGLMVCESFEIAPGVCLTRRDVREFQLAKAAVSAALQTLLHRQDVQPEQIDKLVISGGFSAKINAANAVKTGLLPAALREKCVAAGNSSLLGTAKLACGRDDLSALTARMEYVDLTADPGFSARFMDNMAFDG